MANHSLHFHKFTADLFTEFQERLLQEFDRVADHYSIHRQVAPATATTYEILRAGVADSMRREQKSRRASDRMSAHRLSQSGDGMQPSSSVRPFGKKRGKNSQQEVLASPTDRALPGRPRSEPVVDLSWAVAPRLSSSFEPGSMGSTGIGSMTPAESLKAKKKRRASCVASTGRGAEGICRAESFSRGMMEPPKLDPPSHAPFAPPHPSHSGTPMLMLASLDSELKGLPGMPAEREGGALASRPLSARSDAKTPAAARKVERCDSTASFKAAREAARKAAGDTSELKVVRKPERCDSSDLFKAARKLETGDTSELKAPARKPERCDSTNSIKAARKPERCDSATSFKAARKPERCDSATSFKAARKPERCDSATSFKAACKPERNDSATSFKAGLESSESEDSEDNDVDRTNLASQCTEMESEESEFSFEVRGVWTTAPPAGRKNANTEWLRSSHALTVTPMASLSPVGVMSRASTASLALTDGAITGNETELLRKGRMPLWLSQSGVQPSWPPRLLWDCCGGFFLMSDIVVIPLDCFDGPSSGLMTAFDWAARFFWSFDIIINFLTGFMDDYGTLELRLHMIWRRYLRSFFLLDLIIALFGWFELLFVYPHDGDFLWVRVIRGLRLLRLARVGRYRMCVELMRWRIESEMLGLVLGLLKQTVIIFVVTHVVACFWYDISLSSEGSIVAWVQAFEAENSGAAPSLQARYAWCIHWALMQVTGLGLLIMPPLENLPEVVYGITMMLLTFVISACFLSMITTSMTSFQLMTHQGMVQSTKLRKYLHANGISGQLAAAVQRSAQRATAELKRNAHEKDVELLARVSKPLKMALRYELHSPKIKMHPFWVRVEEKCSQSVRFVCDRAVYQTFVAPNDVVFNVGELPISPAMLFVKSGTSYYVSRSTTHVVVEDDTLCEAFVWTHWSHVGTLIAATDCRLLNLDVEEFQATAVEVFPGSLWPHVSLYAKEFTNYLNVLGPAQVMDTISSKQVRAFASRAFGANEVRASRTRNNTSRDGSASASDGATTKKHRNVVFDVAQAALGRISRSTRSGSTVGRHSSDTSGQAKAARPSSEKKKAAVTRADASQTSLGDEELDMMSPLPEPVASMVVSDSDRLVSSAATSTTRVSKRVSFKGASTIPP